MEDINQQSSKKRHINYNWSLENWVWFECRCLTRETRFSWRAGSNTSKGKEKKKKNRLWVIYALTFSGAVEHANSGETTPSTQLNWLFDSQLPAPIIPQKKWKADKSVHRPRPSLRMTHWSHKKPRATHLKKTSGGRQTSSSSRMDRQGPRKRQAEGP